MLKLSTVCWIIIHFVCMSNSESVSCHRKALTSDLESEQVLKIFCEAGGFRSVIYFRNDALKAIIHKREYDDINQPLTTTTMIGFLKEDLGYRSFKMWEELSLVHQVMPEYKLIFSIKDFRENNEINDVDVYQVIEEDKPLKNSIAIVVNKVDRANSLNLPRNYEMNVLRSGEVEKYFNIIPAFSRGLFLKFNRVIRFVVFSMRFQKASQQALFYFGDDLVSRAVIEYGYMPTKSHTWHKSTIKIRTGYRVIGYVKKLSINFLMLESMTNPKDIILDSVILHGNWTLEMVQYGMSYQDFFDCNPNPYEDKSVLYDFHLGLYVLISYCTCCIINYEETLERGPTGAPKRKTVKKTIWRSVITRASAIFSKDFMAQKKPEGSKAISSVWTSPLSTLRKRKITSWRHSPIGLSPLSPARAISISRATPNSLISKKNISPKISPKTLKSNSTLTYPSKSPIWKDISPKLTKKMSTLSSAETSIHTKVWKKLKQQLLDIMGEKDIESVRKRLDNIANI